MLAVAALIAVGTVVELVLAEHTADPVQWVPFALLGVGLLAIGAAYLSPSPGTIRVVRGLALLLAAGGAFGMWEHLEHNYAFQAEIRPEAPAGTLLWEAVFGASPLLAPGVVGVTGLLAALSTLRGPTGTPASG